MEFAYDPPAAEQSEEIMAWLLRSPVPSGSTCWALLDAALVDAGDLERLKKRWNGRVHRALDGSSLTAFGKSGPHLFEISPGEPTVAADIAALMCRTGSVPALSWLRAHVSVAELQRLCAYLAKIRIEQRKSPLHCRFSDTRVLPELLNVLSAVQTQRVSSCISQWAWSGRLGQLEEWRGGKADGPLDDAQSLGLSIDQFRSMQDAAEPDGMFMLLMQKAPELVPDVRRGGFHGRLAAALDLASRLQVDGVKDRLQFLVLYLSNGEDFHRAPELESTWAALRQAPAPSLTELMKQWPDSTWEALEAGRVA